MRWNNNCSFASVSLRFGVECDRRLQRPPSTEPQYSRGPLRSSHISRRVSPSSDRHGDMRRGSGSRSPRRASSAPANCAIPRSGGSAALRRGALRAALWLEAPLARARRGGCRTDSDRRRDTTAKSRSADRQGHGDRGTPRAQHAPGARGARGADLRRRRGMPPTPHLRKDEQRDRSGSSTNDARRPHAHSMSAACPRTAPGHVGPRNAGSPTRCVAGTPHA